MSVVMNLRIFLNKFLAVIVINQVIVMVNMQEIHEKSVTVNKPVIKSGRRSELRFSAEYVRCYCNLPTCVSTNYMCKSDGGGCFSEFRAATGVASSYRGRHGCLELLDQSTEKLKCQNEEDEIQENPNNTILHCCYHNMCNYGLNIKPKFRINTTSQGEGADIKVENISNQEPIGYSNSEVWFRAATIAVPICGAVILFVLIVLAMKILKSERDNSYDHKLGSPMYIHQIHLREKPYNKYFYEERNIVNYDPLVKKHQRTNNSIYRPIPEDIQRYNHVPLLQNSQENGKNENYANNQLRCGPLNKYLEAIEKDDKIYNFEKHDIPRCHRTNTTNVEYCNSFKSGKEYVKNC